RLAGSGFKTWAQMNVDLKNGLPYDAGAANGLKFWMKGNAAQVIVGIATPETTVGNAFAIWLTPDPDTWREYDIPFAALRQYPITSAIDGNLIPGAGALDPSALARINFTVATGASTPPFEIWVDDLAFYTCSGAGCELSCSDPKFPVACQASASK